MQLLGIAQNPRISRVSEYGKRRFDAIIRNEQLHAGAPTFHAQAYTDDDGRYAGSVQCDPSQIGFDVRRVALYCFH